MLADDIRVPAHQPLAADREAAITPAFRNAGLLQQGQRATACPQKDKCRIQPLQLAVNSLPHFDAPAIASLSLQVFYFMSAQ